MENTMIHNMTPEEIMQSAEALVGENLALRQTIGELRGRLREARRSANHYRAQYKEAMKYQFDAETNHQRNRARVRELMVAVAGAAVLGTCLMFTAAACWGWWHG